MAFNVEKGWGSEWIFADNEEYCGKLLIFSKAGNMCSFHFHMRKRETWFCSKGSFILRWIDTQNGDIHEKLFTEGEDWENGRGIPHQLVALEDNSIVFEVSTPDDERDSLRISPGNSQLIKKEEVENDETNSIDGE